MRSGWGTRYSIVASTLALLFALGGTAYAVNTVRSSDIVDGAVRSVDIRNGTVGTADIGAGSLGRSPRLVASINGADGALIRGRGVTSTLRNGAGSYDVDFNRTIVECAASVTSRDVSALFFTQLMNNNVSIFVRNAADVGIDASFDLILVC
jgi:hypothetical protein